MSLSLVFNLHVAVAKLLNCNIQCFHHIDYNAFLDRWCVFFQSMTTTLTSGLILNRFLDMETITAIMLVKLSYRYVVRHRFSLSLYYDIRQNADEITVVYMRQWHNQITTSNYPWCASMVKHKMCNINNVDRRQISIRHLFILLQFPDKWFNTRKRC